MSYGAHKSYKSADIITADRGKLVIMIYDHCIKWLRRAEAELAEGHLEKMVKSVQKAQAGLTELMCALDMDRGGDIAKNLFNLYDFYSKHLTLAIKDRSPKCLADVAAMLGSLREAWVVAVENVRREDRASLAGSGAQLSLVS
ncbi:MAG TPA: flagellar export chaperone FliS [Fibrobacteria bacterium]|nr:flagellar export chaperone FliS [Fibrobacteria bacterium]